MGVKAENGLWVADYPFEQRSIPKEAGFLWHGGECKPSCVACKSGLRLKVWWSPKPECVARLKSQCDPSALALLNTHLTSVQASRATSSDLEIPCNDGLAYLPYQKAGIAYAISRPNTLIGDEMGLGKTPESIGVVNAVPEIKNVLAIVPASLRINWNREATKWLVRPFEIFVVEKTDDVIPETANFVIVNYELIRGKKVTDPSGAMAPNGKVLKVLQGSPVHAQLMARGWDLLIVDECHRLKDPDSLQTISILGAPGNKKKDLLPIKGLRHRTVRNVFLSGTPILNRPVEFHPILAALAPAEFGNFWTFAKRYCDGHQDSRGHWDFKGASNLEELQEKMRATCLFGDSLVCTEYGGVTIRDLVSRRLPIRVWSSDKLGRLSLKPIVGFSAKPHRDILVKVCCAEGELICTGDHRIYTDQGEIRADEITSSHYVFALRKTRTTHSGDVQSDSKQSNILLSELRWDESPDSEENRLQKRAGNQTEFYSKKMRRLRDRLHGQEQTEISTEAILHVQLPREAFVSVIRARATIEGCQSEECSEKNDRRVVSKTTCDSRAACRGYPGEDKTSEAFFEDEFSQASSIGTQNFRRSALYRRELHGCRDDIAGRQDDLRGHSDTWMSLSDRGRWGGPCQEVSESEGQTERFSTESTRVLGVEILGMGNRRNSSNSIGEDQIVYDIEVEDNHNFFANDILVHNCMIRRLKKDVLLELPPKRRQVILLPVDGAAKAVAAEQKAWKDHEDRLQTLGVEADFCHASGDKEAYKRAVEALKEAARIGFEEIAKERQAVAMAKLPKVIEHIENAFEQGLSKLIVFGYHHGICNAIVDHFGAAAVKLTGEVTSDKDRQAAVDRFQTDPNCKLFVGSIGAAGVGHTLTAATVVMFAELDWVPAMMNQCEDRAHRIGQKNQVLIQHLVLNGSLDSRMATLLVEKQEIADSALDSDTEIDVPALASPRRSGSYPVPTDEKRSAARRAMQVLAAMCDGAKELDGAGFNRIDTNVGKKLAMTPVLTDGQVWMASSFARKYRGQLSDDILAPLGLSGQS